MEIVLPNANTLETHFSEAQDALVSVPFYTQESLDWVTPSRNGTLEFWTRLNPYDWANQVSDLDALLDFIRHLGDDRTEVRVHRSLHAKIFLTDSDWAWVGSPNLTVSAFNRNVEVACQLRGDEVAGVVEMVDDLRDRLTELTLDQLAGFAEVSRDAVEEHRHRSEVEETGDMQAAVDLADELLGAERTWEETLEIPPLDDFIDFLESREESAAEVVVDRHYGAGNLQGHVKQSYFASMLYLLEPGHPDARERLLDAELDGVPSLDEDTLRSWQEFLDRNARYTDEERDFSLSVLRNILPERLGGYTTGGGGASPTFKRVFPLAAHFVEETGIAE